MDHPFSRPSLRRAGLLCLGVAFGLMISPGHDSAITMAGASVLAFVFVGLVSRYGLPS
jgi:hypothetical protein